MEPLKGHEQLCLALLSLVKEIPKEGPLVPVCVGTDRSTGDSLGPLVGSMLLDLGFKGEVYGTLDNPVHAENLHEVCENLDRLHKNAVILGVDACLGARKEVGTVIVKAGPLKPGLGVKKNLRPLGDLHVAAVVNVGGFMEYMVLQSTRLSLVMKLARMVSKGIHRAAFFLDRSKKIGSGN